MFCQKIGQHLATVGGLSNRESALRSNLLRQFLNTLTTVLHRSYPRDSLLVLTSAGNYELSDLPSGYALFLHHKLQKSGEDRTDIYMFVSVSLPASIA